MSEKKPNEDAKGKDVPLEEIVTEVNRVPLWDPEHDDVLVCRQVRQETHDVKTFVFSAREPRAFRFYPGQFMTFELPVEAWSRVATRYRHRPHGLIVWKSR